MGKISLNQSFIETFESSMKNKGFMRKGHIFHRIVNGKIVQLISYCKFSGSEFTVQFSIEPLCAGYEYSTFMDNMRICELFKDIEPWEYEYKTDGYKKYMPKALELTKERLFPLFDLIVDYKSYFEERRKIHHLSHFMFSQDIYMINMFLGNYEECGKLIESKIINSIEMNQNRWGTNHHINPDLREDFEQTCKEYYRIKEAIYIDEMYKDDLELEHFIKEEQDPSYNGSREYIKRYVNEQGQRPLYKNARKYIEQYIQEKEQKSLKSYVEAFTTPKKYETFLKTGELPFKFIDISLN